MNNDIYMKSYANKVVYINGKLKKDLESERQYDGNKLKIMDRNFDKIIFQELDNNDIRRLLTKPSLNQRISLRKTIKNLIKNKKNEKQTKKKRRRKKKSNKKKKRRKKKKNWLQKTAKRIKKLF